MERLNLVSRGINSQSKNGDGDAPQLRSIYFKEVMLKEEKKYLLCF